MLRFLIILIASTLGGAPALAEMPEAVDPAEIPNYKVIRPGLAFGGQPAPETVARLGEMGFRTIVNIRTEQEGAVEEGKVVRAQGLDFVWVPVTSGTFSMDDVIAVETVLDDPESAPVLVHCASGNRVAAVWGVIRARQGRNREQVEEESRAAGLHSPSMWDAVQRVLGWVPEPVPAAP